MRKRLAVATVAMAAALGLAVSGCSSDSSGSGGAGSPASEQGLATATANVEKFTQPPTSIGNTTPVGKPIPAGKKIVFMNCGVEICTANGKAAAEAAAELGWTMEQVNVGVTPQEVNAAWARVARQKPDGVIATGHPSELFAESLQQLHDAGVPVVECCVTGEKNPAITAMVGERTNTVYSDAYASWVTNATNGNANVLWVGSADYPVIAELKAGFDKKMAEYCPGCKIDAIDVAAVDFGNTLPTKVVGHLRSHPEVNYVVLGYDGMAAGLPQALASAGLTEKAPFIGLDALPMNKQFVVDGKQAASIAFPIYESMWMAVDALARHFVGADLAPSIDALLPTMIYTKENIKDPAAFEPLVPNYREQFAKLWGKAGTE
ncbi:hypothetical protein ACN93_19410 [Gordonia paraffinivorans]|uniref:sugar ABC transporter substrate-binding protein n=1 Tax=Gordonia paraffinivorans TaxID=175628 RepID=UPI000D6097F7|nr:substrate-binding domain-containing protein [Gordonia paraffinivorans]PWD41490.1 hypothetical protein ACN93_19410 [Gordonia paraffinivorans]